MPELPTRDAVALHRALDKGGDEIEVRVSRETAEWLARLVDARARGQRVLLTRGNAEVTPAEAAELLGMSRPQVRAALYTYRIAWSATDEDLHKKVALEAPERHESSTPT